MSFNVIQALNNLSAALAGANTAPNTIAAIDEITAAIAAFGGITGPIVSGTYLPVASGLFNVTSATPTVAQYMRIGHIVTVSGLVQFTPTGAGLAIFELSLPFASVFTVATIQLAGAFNGSNLTDDVPNQLFASAANNAEFVTTAITGNATSATYTYTYQVLP
jgi:hypothetical protein